MMYAMYAICGVAGMWWLRTFEKLDEKAKTSKTPTAISFLVNPFFRGLMLLMLGGYVGAATSSD